MTQLKKLFANEGIELKQAAEGVYHLDCPKPYCTQARGIADRECLRVDIKTTEYGEWKCRHCLWAGHIGDKSSVPATPAEPPPPAGTFYGINKIDAHAKEIIIAQHASDRLILLKCGVHNTIALPAPLPSTGDDRDSDPFSYLASAAAVLKLCPLVKLVFDNTQQGNALRNEISRRIGPGKCWIVNFTAESLARTYEQFGADGVCADVNEATPLPIRGLYELRDFERELSDYFEGGMAAGVNTGWPNVDQLYTVVPGQLTVVTGIPNSGKSEWVDALTLNLALNHSWRFAAFSPENGKAVHATKLIEKRVEMPSDPKSRDRMSYDTFIAGAEWVRQHYYFIESTDMTPTLDWILERASDAALRYGIKGLILDPWNRIEKKLDKHRSETDYVAEALPRIMRFLISHGIHGWLVVHPKQQIPDRKTGEIHAPSLYDMAGSAHFVNMADNGIVIHRSDSIDDTTEVHVKKVRFKHVGKRGLTKLSYNVDTGRYSPLDKQVSYLYGTPGDDSIKTYEAL